MKEITSTTNSLVKETVKLHQKKYRNSYILIEGKKALDEAIKANLDIKYIFSLKEDYKNFETYLVNEAVMKKISTTESPASVAAVVCRPKYFLPQFEKFKNIVLLDNIKDAGNLGTIIRACSAFKIDGILLFGDATDPFSPKVIRSTAGNMFKIPILKVNIDELSSFKKSHKFLATVVSSGCHEFSKDKNTIIMFGSEANGLCKELLNIADACFTLKMSGNVESLNLALSAGIILWEFSKK